MDAQEINFIARQIFVDKGFSCDCGQENHLPDCEWVLSWDEAYELALMQCETV